jgi:hypothetical protein
VNVASPFTWFRKRVDAPEPVQKLQLRIDTVQSRGNIYINGVKRYSFPLTVEDPPEGLK